MDLNTEFEVSKYYYWAGKDFAIVISKIIGSKFDVTMHVDMIDKKNCLQYIYTLTSKNNDVIILQLVPHIHHVTLSYYKVGKTLLTEKELGGMFFTEIKEFFTMVVKKYTRNDSKNIKSRKRYGRKHIMSINKLFRTIEVIDTLKEHNYIKFDKK